MKFVSRVTHSLLALLLATSAQAEVTLHGFGSFRAGELSAQLENPNIVDFYQKSGLRWQDESLFGLQSQVDLSQNLSFNAQLIAKGINDYQLDVTLAFAKYQLSPDQQIRFGRLSMPLFSQSDVQYVGYAHDYSRLPKATYWRFEFETADGVSYEAKHTFGDAYAKYSLSWAEFRGDVFKNVVAQGVEIQLQDMRSVSLALGYQNVEFFAGGLTANSKAQALDDYIFSPAVKNTVSVFATDLNSQLEFYRALSLTKDASYKFFGGRWHFADWKLEFERAKYGILDSVDALTNTQYLALSRRFDDVIVTVHRERYQQDPYSAAGLTKLNNEALLQLAQQISVSINETGYAMNVLSMRYDFAANFAWKADYFRGNSYSHGPFTGFSLGVDFVF